METCRSPLELLRRAYELGQRVWPDYGSPFSRHDFTRPQLFACLVVRESLRLSYRKAEAFLADVPDWLASIGMNHAPDHNTLWRAFAALLASREIKRALDRMANDAGGELSAGLRAKPLTIDSTCYEPRHRSRHYDRICRKMDLKTGQKYRQKPGKYQVATCGVLSSTDEIPLQTQSRRQALRPTVAERNDQQHDETQPGRKPAFDPARPSTAGDAAPRDHTQPNAWKDRA